MKSGVATRTFGAASPAGNGHSILPRLPRLVTPGGVPTATATVHSFWMRSGSRLPSMRATSAVCSHSSRLGVRITTSGAYLAQLLTLVLLLKSSSSSARRGFLRLCRGASRALTPSIPSQATPIRGRTRLMVPKVLTSTTSPEPNCMRFWATTRWPILNVALLRSILRLTSTRSHGTHPRPSAISMYWTVGLPSSSSSSSTDEATNSSPMVTAFFPLKGDNASGRCSVLIPCTPA
mmetsp:Transcript_67804/g.180268  ORF Transcript_67804/g.180268 Transcript_67804/m.180268 type:complete len:235 (-) Transcript_67804:468-1172(-)